MNRFVSFTAMTALSLFVVSPAFSTDYNSGVVTKAPSVSFTDVEFGSGWYLRGDISYNIGGESQTEFTSIDTNVGQFLVDADYDDSIGARVGFGYYLSPNLRLEVSAEHIANSTFSGQRPQSFGGSLNSFDISDGMGGFTTVSENVSFDAAGNVTSASPIYRANVGTTASTIAGEETIEASHSASNIILNTYYDLPNMGQFKPYLGAGIGLGRITYNQTRTLTCTPLPNQQCANPAGALGAQTTSTRVLEDEVWAPAYQFTAGTGIQLDEHWTADVGYSYTTYGDGGELSYNDGTAFDADGFDIHQVRMGLRYELW